MRDWNKISWTWWLIWLGVSVGTSITMFLNGAFHRQISTAEFAWCVTCWIAIVLPDLVARVVKMWHRKHGHGAL